MVLFSGSLCHRYSHTAAGLAKQTCYPQTKAAVLASGGLPMRERWITITIRLQWRAGRVTKRHAAADKCMVSSLPQKGRKYNGNTHHSNAGRNSGGGGGRVQSRHWQAPAFESWPWRDTVCDPCRKRGICAEASADLDATTS